MKRGNVTEQIKKGRTLSEKKPELKGNDQMMISTGSTLLNLAISWERARRGGIPAGIIVEIFGPSSAGKTTLLCEIGGDSQRRGGEVLYLDPEGRLNPDYAHRLGLNIDPTNPKQYKRPNTVPEAFAPIRKWEPKPDGVVHTVIADSLAALSTDLELDNEEGDKMGMRRAKEFSEELRKICRVVAEKNFLIVASNQLRQTQNAYGEKFKSPGGEAVGYYSSLRLKVDTPTKIKKTIKVGRKEVEKVVAISTDITVYKSSVGEPYNKVPVFIDLAYGIDNIRGNLKWLKDMTGSKVFCIGEDELSNSISESIKIVEEGNLEKVLEHEVIQVWHQIQMSFRTERKEKVRE